MINIYFPLVSEQVFIHFRLAYTDTGATITYLNTYQQSMFSLLQQTMVFVHEICNKHYHCWTRALQTVPDIMTVPNDEIEKMKRKENNAFNSIINWYKSGYDFCTKIFRKWKLPNSTQNQSSFGIIWFVFDLSSMYINFGFPWRSSSFHVQSSQSHFG